MPLALVVERLQARHHISLKQWFRGRGYGFTRIVRNDAGTRHATLSATPACAAALTRAPVHAGRDFSPMSQFRRLRNWSLTPAKLQMLLELEVLGIRRVSVEFGTVGQNIERLYARCAALPPRQVRPSASLPIRPHAPSQGLRRVGRREAEVSTEYAQDDRLLELYMPSSTACRRRRWIR